LFWGVWASSAVAKNAKKKKSNGAGFMKPGSYRDNRPQSEDGSLAQRSNTKSPMLANVPRTNRVNRHSHCRQFSRRQGYACSVVSIGSVSKCCNRPAEFGSVQASDKGVVKWRCHSVRQEVDASTVLSEGITQMALQRPWVRWPISGQRDRIGVYVPNAVTEQGTGI
jgi:hypothetical protein